MYLWGFFVIVTLGLLGCSSKEALALQKSYQSKSIYHKTLQKTEKIQLYQDKITTLMLTATYLYNNTSQEQFIIAVHLDDDSIEDYRLKLNGKRSVHIEALSPQDKRLKNLSFVSEWAKYSIISFAHTKQKKLILSCESDAYGKGLMYFAKGAKYVLD